MKYYQLLFTFQFKCWYLIACNCSQTKTVLTEKFKKMDFEFGWKFFSLFSDVLLFSLYLSIVCICLSLYLYMRCASFSLPFHSVYVFLFTWHNVYTFVLLAHSVYVFLFPCRSVHIFVILYLLVCVSLSFLCIFFHFDLFYHCG